MVLSVRNVSCAAAIVSVMALAGCRHQEASTPAVATPSLSLSKDRVPIGSAVTLTYKFQVAPNASLDKDYRVFVHVLDPEGEQMWTDDHVPSVPTSQWKPGQTVEYSRTIFVPTYPYIGEAIVRVGLYDPATGTRPALDGKQVGRHEYEVARFQVLPQSDNIFLIYKSGWYPAESDSKNPTAEWQWTGQSAVLSFRNPKKDCTLYLEYDSRPDLFSPPQQVSLRTGDAAVATFAAEAKAPTLLTFPITAAQLGTGDMAQVSLDIDRTFTPGGTDTRTLGIRIFHAYLAVK